MTTYTDAQEQSYKDKGAKAAVFKPMFGQAHQQYFTPHWLCETNLLVAQSIFDLTSSYMRHQLRVIDPTAGTGRLLIPFKNAGHSVTGIELDTRIVSKLRAAIGKEHGYEGDICAYAPLFPVEHSIDIAVINPPYGLWWPATGILSRYELASTAGDDYEGNIESQNMVLELATNNLTCYGSTGGLLLAILSGRFLDTNPRTAAYINKHYQVVANIKLPAPFKEYGIEVDATYLVAYRAERTAKNLPLEMTYEGNDPGELAQHVAKAFATITHNGRLPLYSGTPLELPQLSMATDIQITTPTVEITAQGVRPADPWSAMWTKYYSAIPLTTYNQAQGTDSDVIDAISLPNILINGLEATSQTLTSLGFAVETSAHARQAIELKAQRYQRDRLPIQELAPTEFFAWYKDGPITAQADANAPGFPNHFIAGREYNLQVRWEREAKQFGEAEDHGTGRDAFTMRTFIDRGQLTFRFIFEPTGQTIVVHENNPDQVRAMVDAFGVPEVPTVDSLPECERINWAKQLDRLVEDHASRNGGLRPNDIQTTDILRMATKRNVALLYDMGGGKTMTSAFWAELRRYKRVLIVTPASVVPGIIEDLQKWGFYVHPRQLDHSTINQIRAEKRAGEKPNRTTFYVASYESLGLEDGHYDEWEHDVFDRQGNHLGTHKGNHRATCSHPGCSVKRASIVKACPKCGAYGRDFSSARGSGGGGPRFCRACGYVAYTTGTLSEATATDEAVKSNHMAPLGGRIKRLFSCVILDEVQDAKSKGTLKGETTRALKPNGKAVLSGTWIKGYVTDLFWSAGWLAGFGSPLWPFPYNGGAPRFVEQFGTFKFITKEFAHTLQTGQRHMIPSVSNLARLWRLLSPFTIRRLKEDFLPDLPPKTVEMHWLPLDPQHRTLYNQVEEAVADTLKRELQRDKPDMGVISMALWWGRYAASCPTEEGAPHYAGAYGIRIKLDEASPADIKAVVDQMWQKGKIIPKSKGYSKVTKALELVREIRDKKEKVIVFTSLRGVYAVIERELKRLGIGYVGVDGVQAKRRNHLARKFEADPTATVLLAGTGTLNRGVTITGANHVIILNTEWSPETTLQAEDRPHRPGQTKPVTVHYILSQDTIDEQMWEMINQKHQAQQAVFDKVPQDKSVEEIMAEATSAQLAVAQALITIKREQIVTPDSIPALPASSIQLPASSIQHPASSIEQPTTHHTQPATPKQLELLDLYKRYGPPTKRPAKKVIIPEQQLPLFDLASA